ncbi:Probable type I restriction enzyme BthVORF4518P M protein [Chlamydia trachomatis]|nr:Probable type I restriction enzyme BthVORF4518P M protein [Chlamydia trachomatis]
MFPTLKNLEINEDTPLKQRIVRYVFEDAQNYMKDGVLLRQVINVINEIDFSEYKERHEFGEIYETILKSLQSAGNAGEFYTPRAVTDFMVQMIKPQLGEKVADFACGTGGFLTSTLKYLEPQKKNEEDVDKYNTTIYGIEKKPMPYLLCITNMLLHDVDEPKIYHANSLEKNVRDYKENDKFDVILMNPPYGGSEKDAVKNNFPAELRSSETADLFMDVIMFRLKKNGRCAVIIPDGFLFGEDNAKVAIKTKLMNEFNLHTIVRMPHSVFAPYTSITTNILFFDNTHPTEETWVYRMDMPDGYKNFSKTKPILLDHFKPVVEWWNNREEITIDEFPKAKKYSKKEIEELHYNLDLCGYPHIEDEILEPKELIQQFREKRESYNAEMEITLAKILEILDEDN